MKVVGRIIEVELSKVRPFAHQPRKYFDQAALRDLARSIKSAGLQNPISVRRCHDGKHDFELVDGQRRWHACQMAGMTTAPAHLREDLTNADDQFLASVVSNFAREGHTPMEIANAIQRLRKRPEIAALPLTEQAKAIGDLFGRSNWWVYQHERLLRLDPEVVRLMSPRIDYEHRLSVHVAFLLSELPANLQVKFATRISKRSGGSIKSARRILRALLREHNAKVGHPEGRNAPNKQRASLYSNLRILSDAADDLLAMTMPEFTRIFAERPIAEQESILFRLEECLNNLAQWRDAVKGAIARAKKAAA